MQRLVSYIVTGWPRYVQDVHEDCKVYFKYKDELSTRTSLIFRNDQIVILFALRKTMIDKVHVSHFGVTATLNLPRETIKLEEKSKQEAHAVQKREEIKTWHKRLGHLSTDNMKKLLKL
ncbi:hypothetical protein X777_08143 [Ooceraea biroi]|uniref:GAG-pre-integrase domain-containing protein n=1 Tax=Ooceraea biroi TaxID=2015173 RepID=A0A026W9T7_OOCBI|nr:hypothetical protein X777_08143 [Ooceraea biroi]